MITSLRSQFQLFLQLSLVPFFHHLRLRNENVNLFWIGCVFNILQNQLITHGYEISYFSSDLRFNIRENMGFTSMWLYLFPFLFSLDEIKKLRTVLHLSISPAFDLRSILGNGSLSSIQYNSHLVSTTVFFHTALFISFHFISQELSMDWEFHNMVVTGPWSLVILRLIH